MKNAVLLGFAAALVVSSIGCHSGHRPQAVNPFAGPPRELQKAVLPEYVIEPPDILVIEALNATPKAPYKLRAADVVSLTVKFLGDRDLPEPINGLYRIEQGGVIVLGGTNGLVKISGLNVAEATREIEAHLSKIYREGITVNFTLAETSGVQLITGQHLVAQDGRVTLGNYGRVSVVGMTIGEAKSAIEAFLSQYFEDPVVSVDVFAYNSKFFYVVTQGGGLGQGVIRLPVTGNETVLDAVAQVNGFDSTSSTKIWVARPGQNKVDKDDILPVDWCGITKYGDVTSNYQLMPGDRVYIAEDKLVRLDTELGKMIAPIERLMGFSILGADTATRFSGNVLGGGGDSRFNGGP